MNKKWTKQHAYLLIGIILVTALFYYIGYASIIKPISEEIQSVTQQFSMFEKQLSQQSIPEEQDAAITKINEQIPPEKSLDTILFQLNDIAKRHHVNIYFIETNPTDGIQEEETSSMTKEYVFSLEAMSSEMKHIQAFLKDIESSNLLMVINQMDIRHTSNEVTASITLTTFYQANE